MLPRVPPVLMLGAILVLSGCNSGSNGQLPRAPANNGAPANVEATPAKSGNQEGSKPQTNLKPD
jgi:hypothetical protein